MGSLYELLCHQPLSSSDPLLDELLSYLPTRFSSHIFDYIVYEGSDDDPTIPTPKYLLSTPTIQPISLKISKTMFVHIQYQRTSMHKQ